MVVKKRTINKINEKKSKKYFKNLLMLYRILFITLYLEIRDFLFFERNERLLLFFSHLFAHSNNNIFDGTQTFNTYL